MFYDITLSVKALNVKVVLLNVFEGEQRFTGPI